MSDVFGAPTEGLQFQVYGARADGDVSHPGLMVNEDVVHFALYAALLSANLLSFLDRLGSLLKRHRRTHALPPPAKCYSPGFPLLREMIQEAKESLERAGHHTVT